MISLKGLDKAEVLAALVNNGTPRGMGVLQAGRCSKQAAEVILSRSSYIDYAMGVPIKADFGGETLDPWGYDRDHGSGAARRALSGLLGGAA